MGFSDVFKKAFPFISAAASIGGPLGTMAANAVGKAIGVDSSSISPSTESISDAIAAATSKDPDAMLKLKSAEQDFQLQMQKLGFDQASHLEDIAEKDRESARSREIAVRDHTPIILSISVTGGFFGLLWLFAFHTVPTASQTLLNVMLGSLGTAWLSIIGYYFGSSSGSAAKTVTIDKMLSGGKSTS